MSVINYSKWDHIEISDDEAETHPNVDTPSLFKWRHEARLQRKEEEGEQPCRDRGLGTPVRRLPVPRILFHGVCSMSLVG